MDEVDAFTEMTDDAYGVIPALRYSVVESRPSGFALQAAPAIWEFLQRLETDHGTLRVLDVGCGTGVLASYLLNKGVWVTGLDRSPHMLRHAADSNAEHVRSRRARFVEADASEFSIPNSFEIAVSTFNMLNHLPDFDAVQTSLASVSEALLPGGFFLFDINTQQGLESTVDTNVVIDTVDELVFRKRIRLEDKIILYATGCFRIDGTWHRYRETITKIIIQITDLEAALLNAGFDSVVFTADDFKTEIDDPETNEIARVVARKAVV